jgi:hypothetical protein
MPLGVKMAEKHWLEQHAFHLGKLVGNLLTIELQARMVIALQEVGWNLRKVMPPLPALKQDAWVELTPMSNKEDMLWALEKYNSIVKDQRPELKVDAKQIVFLRDALAHGRAFGLNVRGAGPELRLLKFGRKPNHERRVQVTLRVDMTKEWFDNMNHLVTSSMDKIQKALGWGEKELCTYSTETA